MKHKKQNLEVLREYPPIGKYRIRLIGSRDPLLPDPGYLEIREYVSNDAFEGFTRNGVEIKGIEKIVLLQEILSEIVQQHTKTGPVMIVSHKEFKMNQERMDDQVKFYEGMLKLTKRSEVKKLVCNICGPGLYAQSEIVDGVCRFCRKEERKEVQMMTCTLCQREVPAAGPQSGIGYKEETLCGVCLKAAQRVCPHALRKEDGVTCRDCGAQPWSAGRVLKGVTVFTVKAAAGIAKVFVLYTLQAILGSAVTLGLAYFAAKKMGFLP